LGAKGADHRVETGRLVAEACGDLGDGSVLDEERVECFIASLHGRLWFEKEAAAELIIHGAASHESIVSRDREGLRESVAANAA
jgi:hypothetical protein